MRILKNCLPLAAAVGVVILLVIGAAAVAVFAALVMLTALTLMLNPFGLMDGAISTKSRWCWAAGIVCVYFACAVSMPGSVRLFLFVMALVLLLAGAAQNKRFLSVQDRPVSLYYSPRVGRALTAFRAGEKDLGWERTKWRNGGIQAVQTALLMRGIPFDAKSLEDMETAFVLGLMSAKRDGEEKKRLKNKIENLEFDLMQLNRKLTDAEMQAHDASHEALNERNEAEGWQKRAVDAEDQALRYAKQLNQRGETTDEDVLRMLAEGKSGKEIAMLTGFSEAKVSRIKNRR